MARPVSIREVAEAAGISTALVSLALNGRPGVSDETRSHIEAVAFELGYRVDPLARSLRTGRSNTYGLVVRNFSNAFFIDLIAGAQHRALAADATVLAVDSDYSPSFEREHIRRLVDHRVDGLAIAPVGAGDSVTLWQQLRPGAPTVVLNAAAPGVSDVMHVGPDNPSAVEQAVGHLVDRGHRRIAFLTAPAGLMADHDRLVAFQTLAGRFRLEPMVVEASLSLDAVETAVGDALDGPGPPTAVITNSDFTATAVYQAARKRCLAVGRDLAVVGHDDLPTSSLLEPPLTTLRLDRRALGAALFDRLVGAAGGDHFGRVELVVRASS